MRLTVLGKCSIPTKLGELAVHLAQGGYFKEARDLVRHLLAILPDPRKGKADQAPEHYTPNPRARIKSWSYGEILGKHVRELVRRDGLPTFDVLCDLLSAAVRQSLYDGDTKQGDDYSASWRRAIEDHDQNTLKRDLRCMLAEAVRDAAIQIVVKDQGAIRRIVERLERRKLPIFDRIALHLLWTHADSAPDLVTERLTRKDLYDSSKHRHEYTLLLQDRFAHLVPADRERILSWIEEGPDVERFAASHESWTGRRPSAEETERYADHDRLERLWPIRDDLPEPWQHRVASLADRFGQPEHPDFLHYNRFESTTLEDRSPKTVDDLRRMPIEHIASFVQNWQPTDEFRGPSHEGLQYVLMKLVADEPERFAAACHLFQGSSPTYIHAMLQGLREAVTTGKSFPWSPVLELCTQLVSEKGIAQGAAADGGPPGEEPSAANSAIAGLLREALSHDAIPIPINLQDAVWEVLEHLAGTHDPTPADDSPDANRLKTVPFAVTTRVAILDAVISYGIWVVRRLTADHLGTTPPSGLDAIPEVKQVLNDYLDPLRHPTVEVRAFFGRILPRLTAFDTPWVEDNLSRIFPADAGSIHLHDAAWRGFILWNHPNRLVFGMLRDLYGKAVDRIQLTSEQDRHYDPDWQLARHLMIVYWYGEIEAEGEDGLLTRFFAKAPDALRAEAIQFLGMSLGEGNSVPDEVLDRLKRLWKIRLEAAGGRADHVQELTAFGAWLVSEKFDEVWAMAQLKEILQRVGKAEPEDEVVKWLAKVAPRFAIEAVECLGRMSEGFDWDYHVSHWTKHANVVLGTALRDPKPETRRAATDLINHLGSRGHHQFRTLLRDSSGPQN